MARVRNSWDEKTREGWSDGEQEPERELEQGWKREKNRRGGMGESIIG